MSSTSTIGGGSSRVFAGKGPVLGFAVLEEEDVRGEGGGFAEQEALVELATGKGDAAAEEDGLDGEPEFVD